MMSQAAKRVDGKVRQMFLLDVKRNQGAKPFMIRSVRILSGGGCLRQVDGCEFQKMLGGAGGTRQD